MSDIEAKIAGLKPRRTETIIGFDGEEIEFHQWPFPRPPKKIGERIYRPEPVFHPY